MGHIHAIEYYSAIKINEMLIHATKWVILENLNISERRQSQGTWFHSYQPPRKGIIVIRSRLVVAKGWGVWGGMRSDCWMGTRSFIWGIHKSILELDGCGDCITLSVYKMHWIIHIQKMFTLMLCEFYLYSFKDDNTEVKMNTTIWRVGKQMRQ